MISSDTPVFVIPDIHGMKFWRDALKFIPEGHLVFLGDYLDPYNDENGISNEDALYNLYDILDIKRKYIDNVSLLWGNHDLHYLYKELRGSRYDFANSVRLNQFFWQNQECFQFAEEAVICGKRYLFTHAGVGKKWAENVCEKFENRAPAADELNELAKSHSFIEALGAVSGKRGGWSDYGSMIWADCREQLSEENQYKDIVQIFGHTQLAKSLNIENRIYCLDCGKCFRINPASGSIEADFELSL